MKENGAVQTIERNSRRCRALREFGEETSCHGFRYVADQNSLLLKRLLWLVLILACFSALVYQIIDRVIYYYDWPVTVNVGVNYNKTLQFPAVTICNQNAFKASLATEHGLYQLIEKMYSSEGGLDTLLQDSRYGNITLDYLYLNTAHEINDFIFSCSWKGEPCSSDDFTKVLTDHGVCYTWNSNDGYVSSPGVENGLKLRINVEQYEYMPGPHDAAGVKILIHDSLEIPRVYALGQAVSTGANVFAGVQLLKLNNLPNPHGNCSSRELYYLDTYSQGGCKLDCLSRTATEQCGCRHIYMPSKNGHLPVCTIEKYYGCLKHVLEIFPTVFEDGCNCPVPCEFNAYQSDISYASNSKYAANKFLANNITMQLAENLMLANEVTARMDGDNLNSFRDLYVRFNTTLSVIEDNLFIDLHELLEKIRTKFGQEFEHLRSVCSWKKWFYGYQEYVVQKNFIRPRDAYEERHFHVIALAYTEYILMVENNIRQLNSSVFTDNSVRDFLYHETVNKILNRQKIVRRSLINFTDLITAYKTGVGIFNYTYDYAPKSHNDYAVPVHLINDSLYHNAYALKFPVRFESYLNRTFDILSYLIELADTAYSDRNVTEEQIFYGRETFRWLMRNWVYARSVTYYEVIERPYRILVERHTTFDTKCFTADTVIEAIEETFSSLHRKIETVNNTLFNPLHEISFQIHEYFTNFSISKLEIANNFSSGQIKNGKHELDNLMQLILNDDSNILSKLDQLLSMSIDIYDTIVNDEDAHIYYNFSNKEDFLKPFDEISSEITGNYSYLSSMVELYEIVGEHGTEFIKSVNDLEVYLSSYVKMMEINNEFIRDNFLQLDIFYKQMSYEEITQQKAYDPFALICDIGGSMGLFLGASLLSICELFDLIVTHLILPRNKMPKS